MVTWYQTCIMRRLSLGILAGVFLFVAAVIGLMIARARVVSPDSPAPLPSRADYHMRAIYLQEHEDGDSRWTLKADEAEIFEAEGETLLRRVTITIREPDQTWTVTGDEGNLKNDTNDLVIRNDVVLVGSDGTRLETASLHWQASDNRVWTDDPVRIDRDGAVVTGQGLESWLTEERTAVKGRVRATFTRTRQPPLSLAMPGGRGQ